jgi:hypothetical protein
MRWMTRRALCATPYSADESLARAAAERRAEAATLELTGANRRAEDAAAATTLSEARAVVAKRQLTEQLTAASTRARQLEGDPEALTECSLEELRRLVIDVERGRACQISLATSYDAMLIRKHRQKMRVNDVASNILLATSSDTMLMRKQAENAC